MPVTATTQLHRLWREPAVARPFRTGVSLHSHTMYSEEPITGAMGVIARAPGLRAALRRHEDAYQRRTGIALNLAHAFWTPPLSPRQAHRLEERQIEKQLGLAPLVSLTDHDDVRAGAQLRVLERFRAAPVSTEWTVPFGPTFFHLGVHNLPPGKATRIMRELADYTARPECGGLGERLEMLAARPDVLIVLNHPFWDEKGIGERPHRETLDALLREHGRFIHALELNGLRTMRENGEVARYADSMGLPAVAGGDRHGVEPNALLNLSSADSLAGFIDEVRTDRRSAVVFMQQCRQPQALRIVHTIIDILREYPETPEGRRAWIDRVFYRHPETRDPIPFSAVCEGGGARIVRRLVAAMRVVDRRPPSVILTNA